MSAASLNTLNEELDLLSHNDRHGLNSIFRQFTVFITSSLDKLKTASSRQEFNEVFERFLRHLLHHHCNQEGGEEEGCIDEREGEGGSQLFFSSCLLHLLTLSSSTRRLLAQVLRHFCLYPSSNGFFLALLSLLDTHHQKATFDTLTGFLTFWLLGLEQAGEEIETGVPGESGEVEGRERIVLGTPPSS
jgi:hypothetical protein